MKTKYYIVWIEGFSFVSGEKLKTLDNNEHTYTTYMTEALRVSEKDITTVQDLMREQGFASWVVDSGTTFQPTTYVPTGTKFNS